MSVQNPHHFSPLWLFNNSKQLSGQKTSKSGFATLNGGHLPVSRNFPGDVSSAIITDINASFKTKTSEFPSLQSSKPRKSVTVNSGAWSNSTRNKGKLYNTVKSNGPKPQPVPGGAPRPRSNTQGDTDKSNSPKVKVPKSNETSSKFDFFNSLRLDEGLIDSELEKNCYENDCDLNGVDSQNSTPLSSSVETEHRLLKVMGWSDNQEPPLTEEEVLSAKREMENRRVETSPHSPTILSPFPWAPRFYLPSEDEDISTDSEDES